MVVLNERLTSVARAWEISRSGYARMRRNVLLAFAFNGIGVPVAVTGLLDPVWAMVAMTASVAAIFVHALWGRSDLFLGALQGVRRRG